MVPMPLRFPSLPWHCHASQLETLHQAGRSSSRHRSLDLTLQTGHTEQTLLHRGAPSCPAESGTGQRQYHSLQCSPVHGFGRLQSYPPKQQQRRTSRRNQETKNANEFKKPTFQKLSKREGRGAPRVFASWVNCGLVWQTDS